MDKKTFPKVSRVLALLLVISIFTIFVSCSLQNEEIDDVVKQEDQIEDSIGTDDPEEGKDTSKENKEDNNIVSDWKTDEIFNPTKHKDKLTVRFFHTGVPVEGSAEGDLILITTPDGTNMLIDAGMPDCGPKLVEYLNKLDIEKLDYAIGTHMHIDHIGGYPEVISNIDVSKLIVPNFTEYNTSITKNLFAAVDAKNIPVERVKKGDTFKLGEHVDIEILAPEWDIEIPEGTIPEKSAGFLNNNSLVFKMAYKENSFLFTSDIYWEREDILIEEQGENLNIDVLKVPHHGSHTSSSITFVNTVAPDIAIMTSLSPNKDVYSRYKRNGSDVYITGLDGNILIISDGQNLEVIQEHERTIKGYYE